MCMMYTIYRGVLSPQSFSKDNRPMIETLLCPPDSQQLSPKQDWGYVITSLFIVNKIFPFTAALTTKWQKATITVRMRRWPMVKENFPTVGRDDDGKMHLMVGDWDFHTRRQSPHINCCSSPIMFISRWKTYHELDAQTLAIRAVVSFHENTSYLFFTYIHICIEIYFHMAHAYHISVHVRCFFSLAEVAGWCEPLSALSHIFIIYMIYVSMCVHKAHSS